MTTVERLPVVAPAWGRFCYNFRLGLKSDGEPPAGPGHKGLL